MSSNKNNDSPLPQEEGLGVRAGTDNIAIRVSNLSKCYQIYDAPRDRLKQLVLPRLQRLIGKQPKQYFREFWALKDVSFEVNMNGSERRAKLQRFLFRPCVRHLVRQIMWMDLHYSMWVGTGIVLQRSFITTSSECIFVK